MVTIIRVVGQTEVLVVVLVGLEHCRVEQKHRQIVAVVLVLEITEVEEVVVVLEEVVVAVLVVLAHPQTVIMVLTVVMESITA